jgi:hypothetical protein
MKKSSHAVRLGIILLIALVLLACELGGADRPAQPTIAPTQPSNTVAPRPTVPPAQPTAAPVTSLPAAPSNLRAAQISQTEIIVTWQDNSDNETGFRVYLAGTDVVARLGANVNRAALANLTCNVQYQYTVRAVNTAGESQPSNVINVTTSACK